MKKVLFVIARLNGGGAERALCNITLAMPEDVQIDILVNCEEPNKDYEHRGNIISIATNSKKKIRIPFPVRVFLGKYFKLGRLKRTGGYDACISFIDAANIANVLTGNKYCKVLLSERTTLSKITSNKYRLVIKPLAKILYRKADKIVTVSKGVEDDLNENFNIPKDRLMTIYNAYDIDQIHKKSGETPDIKLDKDCFYFLNTGRIGEAKGQWHLIRAFGEIVKKHPESRLIICGQGPYMEMLEQIVDNWNLNDKVIFLGFVKNPYAISAKCDAFVFPSLYEGLPNAVIENMVCGLPVIASDFKSGAREILAPDSDYKYQIKDNMELAEYGIIVPVCSGNKYIGNEVLEKEEEILARAMLRILEDNELRNHYEKQSIKRASDFAIEKKIMQWLELIK